MKVAKGLAGVVVDATALSNVESLGRLSYRGQPIEGLVDRPFAEVVGLLLNGALDSAMEHELAREANLEPTVAAWVARLPRTLHPMKVLQAAIPLLGEETSADAKRAGIQIAARLPAVIACHLRRAPVDMDTRLPYAERFLAGIGASSNPEHARAFNQAQVLQLDHSFNAGTFTARVVGSTGADVAAAMAAGLGALSGPLHGGADQAALELADTLVDERSIRRYVEHTLSAGGRVPGMGHREYRVRDPRALFLEQQAEALSRGTEHEATFQRLRMLETRFRSEMSKRDKAVHANVEFYKGLVYRIVGLPNEYFTAGFGMARAFGYVAHYLENALDNKIYRPQAEYVGLEAAS